MFTSASFQPVYDKSGNLIGNTGGDYNANGDNYDFPNVTSYSISHDRKTMIGKGVFHNTTAVAAPNQGIGEGNEKYNGFRNANFFETDAHLYKTTQIREGVSLQMRFEFFNLFNRPNLQGVDGNMADGGNFGKVTNQDTTRSQPYVLNARELVWINQSLHQASGAGLRKSLAPPCISLAMNALNLLLLSRIQE